MTFDIHGAISSVTLAGSVMSFFATTSVLVSFAIYRHHIHTFRHMLILELMLFEFANNLNNSTSGIWHLKNGELSIGRLCTVNGFIGQFSAQGVDLSILAVAVVTLFTVTRRIYMPAVSMTKRLRPDTPANRKVACLPVRKPRRNGVQVTDHEEFELDPLELVQPNTTATKPAMFPEESQPPPSPRKNRFKEINLEFGERTQAGPSEAQGASVRHRPTASKSGADLPRPEVTGNLFAEVYTPRQSQHSQISALQTNASEFHMRPSTDQVELEIQRMLLLNAYPFMYVLLWAPGLINRLMEASGNPNSKTINVALQAPTQFIGLANALTYGFNHYLRDRLNDLYFRPVIARIKGRIGLY
ncbi:hypothetical protein FVEG_17139 [Fusarium verticillioides 7600]|uniref:Glucose receptor Git3-like N-terminal domain-containing protein n=1 Tax=Gibberella moniliformis (strain M3125 / FGSC 7600) TaxID=334819 RepID=W7NAR4_GIBM7|nr:hypothetical protein FVEG_17139 [Fusarium verticillioides 7600]EWG53557.1 hypothetical protein FVEG_17139 [Fusarium verticillioides 7600]